MIISREDLSKELSNRSNLDDRLRQEQKRLSRLMLESKNLDDEIKNANEQIVNLKEQKVKDRQQVEELKEDYTSLKKLHTNLMILKERQNEKKSDKN